MGIYVFKKSLMLDLLEEVGWRRRGGQRGSVGWSRRHELHELKRYCLR